MKINHRRGFKADQHSRKQHYFFHKVSPLADVDVAALATWGLGGRRAKSRQVASAKRFVNSRFRFHEKAATRRLAAETGDD